MQAQWDELCAEATETQRCNAEKIVNETVRVDRARDLLEKEESSTAPVDNSHELQCVCTGAFGALELSFVTVRDLISFFSGPDNTSPYSLSLGPTSALRSLSRSAPRRNAASAQMHETKHQPSPPRRCSNPTYVHHQLTIFARVTSPSPVPSDVPTRLKDELMKLQNELYQQSQK
jgi:hypothetical protein